ncbi:hypothetical protein LC612_12885 [Nostoc sp. CHAB 5834]|nr:hypothetical protein [Nostoc sp. CHAB 5834]
MKGESKSAWTRQVLTQQEIHQIFAIGLTNDRDRTTQGQGHYGQKLD